MFKHRLRLRVDKGYDLYPLQYYLGTKGCFKFGIYPSEDGVSLVCISDNEISSSVIGVLGKDKNIVDVEYNESCKIDFLDPEGLETEVPDPNSDEFKRLKRAMSSIDT